MSLPQKCLVDTNVAKIANLATSPNSGADVPIDCIEACVEAIRHVRNAKSLVIDDADEILGEYRKKLSLSGQPGVGDMFMKWVYDNRFTWDLSQRVHITKEGDSYAEFPVHAGLRGFDPSDRKFVAVANAHPQKPPILQAADSKWWGFQDALKGVGITVRFLCPKYIEEKYDKKMRK